MKLTPDQLTTIKQILDAEFELTSYQRAARELQAWGFTTAHLHAFAHTEIGQHFPDHQVWNTYGELATLERNQ